MSESRARSTSRTRNSRPTTPLRPSSRSSFRESAARASGGQAEPLPLNVFEPAFAELSDAMADLEANMMHFQLMHESLSRFSESFASFLYGLNMNAFCVDFPEAPIPDSFRRAKEREDEQEQEQPVGGGLNHGNMDGETTFMTTDTSFVDNPTTSSKPTPKSRISAPPPSKVPAPASSRGGTTRGARGGRRGASTSERGRPSGLARARGRGLR